MKIKALAFVVSASCCLQAYSQEQNPMLNEIVVTSSRTPVRLSQVGSSISVLNAEEIKAHGNSSLSTILRQMPGVNTSSNGGAGSTTSLRIRGEEGFRTLTIIDGIRIGDPSGVQITTQLEHVLSSTVDRVEILRGPQGLAYGADAGGVINITSPRIEQGTSANIEAQTGSLDTQQLSGSFAGANELGDIFIQGSDFSTEGFNSQVADSVLQDKDGYENQTIHTRIGFNATEDLRLEFTHRAVGGESEFDSCFDSTSFTNVHSCLANYDLNTSRVAMSFQGEALSHSLAYSSAKTERENFVNGLSSFTAVGELTRWEYLGTLEALPKAKIVFGIDQEEAENNGLSRDNTGMHVEYLSDFSEVLFLTAGLRFDDNDDFGEHTSYRTSAAYLMPLDNGSTLKIRGSLGTGFRAPSPFETAFNQGAFASPPASLVSLREETSQGYEAGVEYYAQAYSLQLVYFKQEIDNAISFDLSGFSGYLQTTGKSRSTGLEFSSKFNVNDFISIKANYTYNEAERPNGQQAIRRPEHMANFGFSFTDTSQKFSLNAFYRLSKNSIDEVFGSPVDLDDFGVLDLSLNYKLQDNLSIFGRVENISDENYQEITGFNVAGQAVYAGVRFIF